MRDHKVGCLQVVEDNRLIGIITVSDFPFASVKLFEDHLTWELSGVKLNGCWALRELKAHSSENIDSMTLLLNPLK
jgi:hypothetical protein